MRPALHLLLNGTAASAITAHLDGGGGPPDPPDGGNLEFEMTDTTTPPAGDAINFEMGA